MREEIKCPRCAGTGVIIEEDGSFAGPMRQRIHDLLDRSAGTDHTLGSIAESLGAPELAILVMLRLMLVSREIDAVKQGRNVVYVPQKHGDLLRRLDLHGDKAIPAFELIRDTSDPTGKAARQLALLVEKGMVEHLQGGTHVTRSWIGAHGEARLMRDADQGRYRSLPVTPLE